MDSVYFSRRLPLRSPEAIRALDHWLHDQHPAYPRLRHCPAEARLWVRQGFDEPGCDVWILRRLHGWLWTSGVPVAV